MRYMLALVVIVEALIVVTDAIYVTKSLWFTRMTERTIVFCTNVNVIAMVRYKTIHINRSTT